eukprot:6572233-Prymnesium_polylepis.3
MAGSQSSARLAEAHSRRLRTRGGPGWAREPRAGPSDEVAGTRGSVATQAASALWPTRAWSRPHRRCTRRRRELPGPGRPQPGNLPRAAPERRAKQRVR